MLKMGNARVAKRMTFFSVNCREASRLQSEAHRLSILERINLKIHLMLCKWCRCYGKQLRVLRRAMDQHPCGLSEFGRPELPGKARQRIKQRLSAENLGRTRS